MVPRELTASTISLSLRVSVRPPNVTLTVCWRSDAWITRTRACPVGAARVSLSTCSRSPDAGPIPATVQASPGVTRNAVDSTGCAVAGAPAARIDTV